MIKFTPKDKIKEENSKENNVKKFVPNDVIKITQPLFIERTVDISLTKVKFKHV